jgi:uncharacterized membrane protein (UPF0127 family)
MKIVNLANNISLSEDALPAYSFAKRLKGLLGRQSLRRGQAMLLRPANSIHTFFMRFPIDVLFVDKNNMVIKTINNIPRLELREFILNPLLLLNCLPGQSRKQ